MPLSLLHHLTNTTVRRTARTANAQSSALTARVDVRPQRGILPLPGAAAGHPRRRPSGVIPNDPQKTSLR